uniref:Uncharacterized protein n=1 Tax=Phlebotomus papatasi TaxID=29031 RepID=A0A1B0DNI2_PHLPP
MCTRHDIMRPLNSTYSSFMSNPYGLKESGPTGDMTAWTSAGLQPTTGYYPYDPTLAAYGSVLNELKYTLVLPQNQ